LKGGWFAQRSGEQLQRLNSQNIACKIKRLSYTHCYVINVFIYSPAQGNQFTMKNAVGNWSRKGFMKILGAGVSTGPLIARAAENSPFRMRKLGKTGLSLPIIGMDGKSIAHGEEAKTLAAIEDGIAGGVTYFDTSVDHMGGRSERRYGTLLVPKYRDRIFLQSRCMARTKVVLPKLLDLSLARLKTDYLDSFLIESVITGNVDEQLEKPDADTFEAMLAAKKSGKIRVAGIRSLEDTTTLQRQLDLYGDAVDMIFIPKATPENDGAVVKARKLGIGIVADVDREAQNRWKNPAGSSEYPDYLTSWVVAMNRTKDIQAFCKRARA
jgi:hypothetical protein